ncbi:hypothetical protein [Shewanella sp. UCD-KL21]|uniref:hypothetical protein n=1 Tax=Shewanella sp. UCD-KL21 TaxID=1917164 RepID=UPI0020C95D07|nr:hypothetical protein [Shewanella sp. UCD-KL21]
MCFLTLYSMGLRLGEAISLQVGDIDSQMMQVHIRNAKGGKGSQPDSLIDKGGTYFKIKRKKR